ncbi:MAG: tRNA (guanine(10)-N(2))-dimethyltransferase [Desulfurococcales archaeon ex4484_204]|nr:MAG: tRNA (guanine(10)-N(2))-dimethyltransferase [Desulfurococcales archaeon ex4484_204]
MEKTLILTIEGKAKLYVPNPKMYTRTNGVYEPSWAPVFYNPLMTFNRDVSILSLEAALKAYGVRDAFVVDALAGTGVRAIRYCLEVSSVGKCIANDIDPKAVNLINRNVKLNSLEARVIVRNEDANTLLYKLKLKERLKITLIDVDPYGSPGPYVRSSLLAVRRGGFIGYTATDIAPLSGARWRAGGRKYDVLLTKTDTYLDTGLRVLLGYIARKAAELERYITPYISFLRGHYYRVFIKVDKGARKAEEMKLKQLGFITYCNSCGYRATFTLSEFPLKTGSFRCPTCNKQLLIIGPIWVSSIGQRDFIDKMLDLVRSRYGYLQTSKDISKLLSTLREEVNAPNTFNIVSASRAQGVNVPKRDSVIECIRAFGYSASKSHLNSTYIRTNAGWLDFIRCIRSLAKPSNVS